MIQSFFTLTELTGRLKVTRATARNQTVARGCPHAVLGSETYFLTDSFEAWLRENETCAVACPKAGSTVDIFAMPN
jgi:hypothetical protein